MIKRELLSQIGTIATGVLSMSPLMSPNSGLPDESRSFGDREYKDSKIQITFEDFPRYNKDNNKRGQNKISIPDYNYMYRNNKFKNLGTIKDKTEPEIRLNIEKDKYIKHSSDSYNYIHTVIKKQNNNKWMKNITNQIVPDNVESEVESILNFSQDIYYKRDWYTTNSIEYSRHPVETLVDLVGDCVDKTILTYSLLESKGYEPGYVTLPGHVAPIVPLEYIDDSVEINETGVYNIYDTEYAFLESTGYDKEPTQTDYSLDDTFYSYTRRDGFNFHNISNVPNHIKSMIKELNDDWLGS